MDSESLATAFPKEQKRVRELLEMYLEIGPAGLLGVAMIKRVLRRAERAAFTGNLAKMIRAYKELQGCE